MIEKKKRCRVWILGAGFSQSLGGPLMGDLLSHGLRCEIVARYGASLKRDDVELVCWLFHAGTGFADGPVYDAPFNFPKTRRWEDAEAFMEVVDNAQKDQASKATIEAVYNQLNALKARGGFNFPYQLPTMEELARLVRRVIVASCSVFMEGTTRDIARDKERWKPYQRWLGLLRDNDSILTFNYDRVVETLHPVVGSSSWCARVCGVDDSLEETEQTSIARRAGLPLLYKLHGSVDWKIENGRIKRVDWSPALLEDASTLAIATPGDSKMEMAGGRFRKLWSQAEAAIREADEVFILGFRFPPSDAHPRDRLMAQFRKNEVPGLNVHVVLGPDESAERRRLLALLRSPVGARPRFDEDAGYNERRLIARSLFVEDFLSDWALREEEE